MTVDDGQRRAELVRRHRDEIPLERGQALFLRQPLLEHRRLPGEHALAAHQLDRILAKDDGGLRHLADLIASFRLADIDVGIVGRQPAHAVGEMQQRAEIERRIWTRAATTITPATAMARRISHNACQ